MNTHLISRMACLALFVLPQLKIDGAELRGQVVDAFSGNTLSGAELTLTPEGGGEVQKTRSGIFGRYEFMDVPPGDHTLKASHPGYSLFSETVSHEPDELVEVEVPLVPLAGLASSIDLFVQVRDTQGQHPIPDVPVRVQRYSLEDPAILEETLTRMTNGNGNLDLQNQPKGHYTFRFNDGTDGAIVPFYNSLDISKKSKIEKTHVVLAQLLAIKQTVTVKVTGFDPAKPELRPDAPIAGVFVDLTGIRPDFEPPEGFDPMTQDLKDFAIPVLQGLTRKTNGDGEAIFDDLPPFQYIVEARKFGYVGPQTLMVPDADRVLPDVHLHPLEVDPATKVEVIVTSPYATPMVLGGLEVKLEGLDGKDGTSTKGIERVIPLGIMPPDPGLPFGGGIALFEGLLPGRYRVSLDAQNVTPGFPALEDGVASVKFRFRASETIEAPFQRITPVMLDAEVVPAKIRGRFYKAEDRTTVPPTPLEGGGPESRWLGPAYAPGPQTGIEFTESALVDLLPPGVDLVAVDAGADGSFSLSILPGFYGVAIPSLDGYWGSNYRARNAATGESFALGWPYPVGPEDTGGIPAHPFGSRGIPISSGDDLEIDLFVRKQKYYLNGNIFFDSLPSATRTPVTDRVIVREDGSTPLITNFSHLAAPGRGSVLFDKDADGSVDATHPILPGESVNADGSVVPNLNGRFLIPAGPGTHKVTVTHDDFVFTTGVFDIVPCPDYGYPGSGEGAPADGVIPMEDNWEQIDAAVGLIDPWTADYDGGWNLELRFVEFEDTDKIIRATRSHPDLFRAPGLGDRLFDADEFFDFMMGEGKWSVWTEYEGKWYSSTFTISPATPLTVVFEYIIGGGAVDPSMVPTPTFDFTLKAVNADNRSHVLTGFDVLMEGASATTRNPTFSDGAYKKSPIPMAITGGVNSGKWKTLTCDPEAPSYLLNVNPQLETPKVTTTLLMIRGSQVKGTLVAKAGMDPEVTAPLDGVAVVIRDRHGNFIRELVTDEEGAFDTRPSALPRSRVIFADINVPGFKPKRIRLASESATGETPEGELDFDLGVIELEWLPEPIITNKGEGTTPDIINRRGVFMVGVNRSDESGPFDIDPDLVASWGVNAENDATFSVELPGYDLASGALAPSEPLSVADPVRSVWIIDPRMFDGNPLSVPATAVEIPGPFVDGIPVADFPVKMRDFLRSLRETEEVMVDGVPVVKPKFPNQVAIHAGNLPHSLAEGRLRTEAGGVIRLPSLPPGAFTPWVIAETERGAFHLFQWKREPTDPLYTDLYGMKLPFWLAGLADILGTVAEAREETLGSGSSVLLRTIPSGLLEFTPSLTAKIETNPDKTLKYDYKLGANFKLGEESPGEGVLGMMSGFAGLNVIGNLEVGWDGSNYHYDKDGNPVNLVPDLPRFKIGGGVGAGLDIKGEPDVAAYHPNIPFKVKKSIISPTVKANASVKFEAESALNIDHTDDSIRADETKFTLTAGGGVGVLIEADALRAAYRTIAATGPWAAALAAVRESELLKVILFCEPRAGVAWEQTLVTRPRSTVTPVRPAGINQEGIDKSLKTFGIGEEYIPIVDEAKRETIGLIGGKTGVKFSAVGGVLGAEASLETEGVRNPVIGFPALEIEFNNWGIPTRARGKVVASSKVFLDAWLVKLSRNKKIGEWPVDTPLNSEALFFLIEMEESETREGLTSAPSSTWCGAEPHLVAAYFGLSQYAAFGEALVYLDPNPDTGGMTIRYALNSSPDGWVEPVEVAEVAGGVLGVATHPLPSGGTMIVWSEITDLTSLVPSTVIKYATSEDGVEWTIPEVVTSTSGTAYQLELVPMPGGDLSLVYLESERGPGATLLDLEGITFSGGDWGSSMSLFDDIYLQGFDAAGPGFDGTEPAQLVGFTDVGGFVAAGWDGTSLTPTVSLDPGAMNELCQVVAGPADTFVAAYESSTGVGFFKKSGSEPWLPMGELEGVKPRSLAISPVDDGGVIHYAAAWSDGTGSGDLSYAYLDSSGEIMAGPTVVIEGSIGFHDKLQLVPVAGSHDALIFAVFENSESHELRSHRISLSDGAEIPDRDGDLLNDLEELRLVDADPTDSIQKIDDVLGGDDFDGDGYPNARELSAGTDATDPESFPGQVVQFEVGDASAFELGEVSAVVYVTRTGDVEESLTVSYSAGGTATAGADYAELAGSIVFPEGVNSAPLILTPVEDDEAEGDESVILTLAPDPDYVIGLSDAVTLSIADTPLDGWRFVEFSPTDLADDLLSGLTADGENDGLTTLLEYAFGTDPKVADGAGIPGSLLLENLATRRRYAAISYIRRKESLDLIYQVEGSDDLEQWTVIENDNLVEAFVSDLGDGTEEVLVREKAALEQPGSRRFLRISVRRP